MTAQIIITEAGATMGAILTVGATLGLALLRGFRRIHDEIGQTAKDTRKEFKDTRKEFKDMREDYTAQFKEGHKEFKDIRENYTAEFKEVHKAIAKNAEAIAGLGGSMRIIETMLNGAFKVDAAKSDHAQADAATGIPADAPEPHTRTTPNPRTAPAAVTAATGR